MIAAIAALLVGAAATPANPETTAMPDVDAESPRALSLDVEAKGGMIEVRLTGLSPRAQGVSYSLEVTGTSTSRHRGSTQLAAGTQAVLSTMRTSAGANWCVKLVAEEEGRAPYEVTRGTCAAG
ncbi:curli-like amyloid fiber formation chaperone CsgH [Erythrobacter oryzae]|uniref:curli-like amyloid fiber formation chaperone CsgH n=1 Tax=Erythrobacter oryzae TaxID=3019556 RepID=UPI0025557FF3|nr:curli-like amyloid fiber formation chaperone CsgH [Erythrobacter sp. COR-2]